MAFSLLHLAAILVIVLRFAFESAPPSLLSDSLLTVDNPSELYPEQSLVDMEASGYFQAACQFVTHEQVHIVKIISDNSLTTQQEINPVFVMTLITRQWSDISACLVYWLLQSAHETQYVLNEADYEVIIQRWHFSQYQRHQLRNYLRRFQVMQPQQRPIEVCENSHEASEILDALDKHLCKLYM